jgi:2,4-dienoyl-CoA reductase-like NADH-dependent reductase (Old Yellow Enzyme family)
MTASTALADQLTIGTMHVQGRLFKAATRETRATDDGFVTNSLLEFYEPMARAGTPMIITGNLYVSPQGKSAGRQAGIDDDDKLSGLREWVELAHRYDVKLIAQLNHGGRQMLRPAPGSTGIVAPSAVREPLNGVLPRALGPDELPGIVESFAAAAARAQQAGFDGVQIHAAHGYLLSQFLTPHTNRRHDKHGGSLTNRARLLLEVLAAIRERVGDDFPVIAKLNGTDMLPLRRGATPHELLAVGIALQENSLDAIEISPAHYESWPAQVLGEYRGFWRAQIREGTGRGAHPLHKAIGLAAAPMVERVAARLAPGSEGFNLPYAERFTRALDIPVIANGGFHSSVAMEGAIRGGSCDAISAARAFIADPYLFRTVTGHADPEGPVCGYCNGCIARFGGHSQSTATAWPSGPARTPCCVEPPRRRSSPMSRNSYPTKTTTFLGLLMLREDLTRDAATTYWSTTHGGIVKRSIPGLAEYIQRHFSATDHGFWPTTETVGTQVPAHWRLDGYAETTFKSVAAMLSAPLCMRHVFYDEQNVFARVLGHPTAPGGGRWWTEGHDDTVSHRVALLLRRRRGVSRTAFRQFLYDRMAPALLAAGARDVRAYAFLPWSRLAHFTPGVAHDNPIEHRYNGLLSFGLDDRTAVDALLATPEIAGVVTDQHRPSPRCTRSASNAPCWWCSPDGEPRSMAPIVTAPGAPAARP